MNMKKILFLSTGGTIASASSDEGLTPQLAGEELVRIVPELEELCQIECQSILNLDSTNIQPEDWLLIARNAYNGLDDCDGIVISHGTDTMAFTASILSYMLVNLNKPVIITGSQLPILDPATDGKRNILNAVQVALTGNPGVYIVFGGKIINGTRAVKLRTKSFEAFDSVNAPYAGFVDESGVFFNHHREKITGACHLDTALNEKVFLLKLVPGIEPLIVNSLIEQQYKGLVIESFGSGGLPYMGRSLHASIDQAIENGMTVVATTQCLHEGCDLSLYDVGIKALKAGVIPAYDMTTEATVTKLMWVLGHTDDKEEIRQMMLNDYCGEINTMAPHAS